MEGRKEDILEWWMLRDSGLLSSVIGDHNRVAAGDYKRTVLFGNNNEFRLNPNLGDGDSRFQVNPNLGDIGFRTSNLYDDLETVFGRMSLANQSRVPNSGIGTGIGCLLSPYGRSVRMNTGFGDPNNTTNALNCVYNRNGFRVRHNEFSSSEILRMSKDQQSCRVLQQMLEEGKPEEIAMIFWEVKNHVCELMVDQSGNYLVQKLFQVCSPQQMSQLLASVIRHDRRLVAICLDMHGTRAMQTMLSHLMTAEQRALVVAALRRITVTLTKSVNGYHVIQHCVKFFSNEEKKKILNVVADNCLDIATDRSGCCVLQHCVENADAQSRERLVAEIAANSLVLSHHPYGNYVVQNILGLRIPHATSEILKHLAGSFVPLSVNKYGSNVVEKCLKESVEESEANSIIQEIVSSPNFLMVLQDPFGNYVVQSALAVSKGPIRHAMVNIINMHYESLHSHPHGKRVLAKTRGNRKRV